MFDFSNENIYSIIDLIEVSIYWKDKKGHYLGCNQYALKIFGVSKREDVIGKTDHELLPNGETHRFVEIDKLVLKNGIYKGEEYGTINGQKRVYLTTKVKLLDKNKNIIIFGTSLDITDMKNQIELEKLNEEVKNRQIIDLINASIYWKDKEGRYLGCNKYALDNVFHVTNQEEIIGKTDYELLPKDQISKFLAVDKLTLETGHYEGEESGTVNEEAKTYFASKNQLLDSQGNVIGLVGISMDITAQKEAEKLKIESEKQKAEIQAQEEFKVIIDEFNHILQKHKFSVLNRNLGVKNNLDNPDKEEIVLNKREQWILYCLSLNKSPKEIALIIGILEKKEIAPATIQAIITKQLYVKFGVYGVSNLIEKASILKLIPFSLEP